MEKYLANMTRPVQNPPQAYEYVEYIRRIKNLTLEANTDIETGDPFPRELQDLRNSLYNIEHETSTIFWDSVNRTKVECVDAMETKHAHPQPGPIRSVQPTWTPNCRILSTQYTV